LNQRASLDIFIATSSAGCQLSDHGDSLHFVLIYIDMQAMACGSCAALDSDAKDSITHTRLGLVSMRANALALTTRYFEKRKQTSSLAGAMVPVAILA
jgi:hypothetical protein